MSDINLYARPVKALTVLWLQISLALGSSLVAQPVQNDPNQKLMMGYQGWFLCQGDGSAANDWRHWFKNTTDQRIMDSCKAAEPQRIRKEKLLKMISNH